MLRRYKKISDSKSLSNRSSEDLRAILGTGSRSDSADNKRKAEDAAEEKPAKKNRKEKKEKKEKKETKRRKKKRRRKARSEDDSTVCREC